MDLLKLLDSVEDKEVKINLIMDGKTIFELKTKNKNIEINIFDSEGVKNLIKGIKR